jgi:hypothetical protein
MSELTFQSIGGAWHLKVDGEVALSRIHELDPARWAVTSVPVVDLQCDAGFIAFMDPAKKGRILVSGVIEARDWLYKHLAGRSRIAARVEDLRLDDIDGKNPDADKLRKAAMRVLKEIGTADSPNITLKQVRDYRATFAKLLANGDGVLCAKTAPEDDLKAFITDIVATVGGVPEASGEEGAGLAQLDKFLTQAAAYDAWKSKGSTADGLPNPDVHPWADDTASAAKLVKEFDEKLEQYFWQCDLLRQEPTAVAKARVPAAELDALSPNDQEAIQKTLAFAPITEPRADGTLPLDAPLNPYYEVSFTKLIGYVVGRALGADAKVLTRDTWRATKATFAPYWAWLDSKPAEPFEKIAADKLKEYCTGPLPEKFRATVDVDLAAAPEVAQLESLEKLVLFQRWLVEFTNNFINLSHLYNPRIRTIFELGTMVIDGRKLEFTIRVVNRAEHKKVATESRIFIVYAAIFDDPTKPALYEVAAPVTKGERGRLIPGKRGVFYSVDGKVYDAVVVEIIEHPISIPEAIKAPFRRTAEFIGKRVEEFAANRQAASEAAAKAALEKGATNAATAKAGDEKKKLDPAVLAGVVASGGLALAAVGSALAFIVSALAKISFLAAIKAIVSILLVICFFAGFLGWLKLRLRNLGPIFEANGWAVNPKMKVKGRLASIFTRTPGLPAGHVKDAASVAGPALGADDAEEEKFSAKRFFSLLLMIVVAILLIAIIYFPTETKMLLFKEQPPKPVVSKVWNPSMAPTPTPAPTPAAEAAPAEAATP